MTDLTPPPALLPCPFCGKSARMKCDDYINGRLIENADYVIECDDTVANGSCEVFMKMYDQDPDLLTKAWNARAAIEPAPDPRDAVIAQLVDALYAIEMWDAARGYPIPYRHRDPMRAALAAAKAVMK